MCRGALFLEGSFPMHAATLFEAFSQLEAPRRRRWIRHPFAGIVVLMLLGMLARIREMEVLVRWATVHWDQLRGPLGFDRDEPPCATTISRTLAKCQVGEFQATLATWLQNCLAETTKQPAKEWLPSMARPPSRDSTTTVDHCTCSMPLSMTCRPWWANGRPEPRKPTNPPCCVVICKHYSIPIQCCD